MSDVKKLIERMRDSKRFEIIVYSSIVLLIVIIFMLSGGISFGRSDSKNENPDPEPGNLSGRAELELEERLKSILSEIDGAGRISVMITLEDDSNEIRGVIVVAEGAKEPRVRTEMLSAVITVLGAGAEKVKVFSMK